MSRDQKRKKEITDTYRVKIAVTVVIPWVKEINELEKLVGGIEIFGAHAVEMESVDKIWFL
jgi:hypothetical protein